MNKYNEKFKYTCSGYRYAPESFRSYRVAIDLSGGGNHQYIPLKLSSDKEKEIGLTRICEGKHAAAALAKKYDRERMKKPNVLLTYGFLDRDNPSRFHYVNELRCQLDAPIESRFRVYKRLKDFLSNEAEYTYSECMLDAAFNPISKKIQNKMICNVDLTKPVRVYLKIAR